MATPGHTAGHQSLFVETNDGAIALAGQAIYSATELAHIATKGTLVPDDPSPDAESYLASAQRLIGLRARRMHFSHDSNVWDRPSRADN